MSDPYKNPLPDDAPPSGHALVCNLLEALKMTIIETLGDIKAKGISKRDQQYLGCNMDPGIMVNMRVLTDFGPDAVAILQTFQLITQSEEVQVLVDKYHDERPKEEQPHHG